MKNEESKKDKECGCGHVHGEEECCCGHEHGHENIVDNGHGHEKCCCKHSDEEATGVNGHDHCRDGNCGHGHTHGGHTHDHDGGCECCAAKGHVDISSTKKLKISDFKYPIIKISVSFVLAATAAVLQFAVKGPKGAEIAAIVLYCAAYLVVGTEYMWQAVKGVFRGDIFNENMLMTVASIGAMALGEYIEGVAVMLLYCVGETLQDAAIAKSKGNIVSLLGLKAESCLKLCGDNTEEIDSENLQAGDLVLVRKGEKIPSDGVVEEGESAIDCSSMTGESMPVAVAVGSEVTGGTVNTGNTIKVRISKRFEDTQASRILKLVEEAQESKPRAQKLISKFASIYTPAVFALAVIVALIPPLFYESYVDALTGIWLKKALVFLVISCPCALVISIPLAFFAGIGRCSKSGVLVKGGNYLEEMRGITVVCMDKTGTLTKGVFEVAEVSPADGVSEERLLKAAAACESMSTHPIALSIKEYTGGSDVGGITDYREYSGKGVGCNRKGADLLAGNMQLMAENGVTVSRVHEGYGSVVYFAEDGKELGYIALRDSVREGAKEVVDSLKAQGKRVIMLTGDVEESAKHVAEEVGIDEYFAGLLPQNKYEIVERLRNSGEKVMFVGDGLNDAPAIKAANLGVCVGGLGNDASVEASDVVLSTGSVAGLPAAFVTANETKKRVAENVVLSLVAKASIMAVSLAWVPMMWLAVVADVGVCIIAIINSVRR